MKNKSLFSKTDMRLIMTCKECLSPQQALFIEDALYKTRTGDVNVDGFVHYHCKDQAQHDFINGLFNLSVFASDISNEDEALNGDHPFDKFSVFSSKMEGKDSIYIKLSDFKDNRSALSFPCWTLEVGPGIALDAKDLFPFDPEIDKKTNELFVKQWQRRKKKATNNESD